MNKEQFDEMIERFEENRSSITEKTTYLFGHCEATLCLADFLLSNNIAPKAILDNSERKHGMTYKGIPVVPVGMAVDDADAAVLIVTRFYEAMNAQLRELGFKGSVIKLVDFNTYADYSLSEETVGRMRKRLQHGLEGLEKIKERFQNKLLIFCPFNALGDIYLCMSYLPAYQKKMGYEKAILFVPSNACANVVRLFEGYESEVYKQKELDAIIQAVIYTGDKRCYIAHQDRPYVVSLHKALYVKKIPLETIYCCGVFGLPKNTTPAVPNNWESYTKLDDIKEGKTAILSPYAKSVTSLSEKLWNDIVTDLKSRGYTVYTNVAGDEKPLEGTDLISPKINEMKSVVEKAGLFIGIRSGICDVIRTADCMKIALYPDYYYCDTKWKAIDMYAIDGFRNIEVKDDDTWEDLKKKIK